jgi:hypothetical protein
LEDENKQKTKDSRSWKLYSSIYFVLTAFTYIRAATSQTVQHFLPTIF